MTAQLKSVQAAVGAYDQMFIARCWTASSWLRVERQAPIHTSGACSMTGRTKAL